MWKINEIKFIKIMWKINKIKFNKNNVKNKWNL